MIPLGLKKKLVFLKLNSKFRHGFIYRICYNLLGYTFRYNNNFYCNTMEETIWQEIQRLTLNYPTLHKERIKKLKEKLKELKKTKK